MHVQSLFAVVEATVYTHLKQLLLVQRLVNLHFKSTRKRKYAYVGNQL